MAAPFLFGGDTGLTYEDLKRRQLLAARMLSDGGEMAPRNMGEGLHSAAQSVMGGLMMRKLGKQEQAGQAQADSMFSAALDSLYGGAPTGAAFAPREPMAPQAIAGDTMTALGKPAAGMEPYRNAIASVESAGSGDYKAVGPTHERMGRALGRYQIMEANLPQWSQEALGRQVSAEEFLANPKLQDAIFDHRFGSYLTQYGDPAKAAQAWFAGPGGVGTNRKDVLGTSVPEYSKKFTQALGGGVQVAQAGGIPPDVLQAMVHPQASDQQRSVLGMLMQQRMQQSDPLYQAKLAQMQNPTGEPFTLSPGQQRFDAGGNVVAGVDPMIDDPTTVREYQFYAQQAQAAGQPVLPYNEWDMARRQSGATSITNVLGGESLTPGQKKIDEAFADTYLDWVGGGYADTAKQIEQLNEAIGIIGSGENISGAIGALPRGMQAFVNPNGTIARELVEEVVQRSLREILGAQFTEREGERLIARAYNPLLDPEENRKRVQRLMTQIQGMAEARQAMTDYFDENGTLRGYKGARPRISDLTDLMASDEEAGTAKALPVGTADSAMPPPPESYSPEEWQRAWEYMTPEDRALFQ